MNSWRKFTIESDRISASSAHLWIDGVEQNDVTNVTVDLTPGHLPSITVTFVGEVEMRVSDRKENDG